ncbi:MAG: hypothetical protein ACYCY5_09230, partial [Sulfuricella sp.]
ARDQRHQSRASPLLPNLPNLVDRLLYNPTEMEAALEQSVRRFGGIDLLIADNPILAAACEPLLELSPVRKTA